MAFEQRSASDSPWFPVVIVALIAVSAYLWLVESALIGTPKDADKLASRLMSKDEIRAAYQKYSKKTTDVKPYLFAKKNRRYIVTGGSGLVGGWIVNHLLQRGEDPRAIRIMDLKPPTRPEALQAGLQFFKTDISDTASVAKAFDAPWDAKVAQLPLTVFHTVAYIKPDDRKADFMPMYIKVNVQGTQNILDAAKAAGTSCFIATSSGSVAIKPRNYFAAPWTSNLMLQLSENADPPVADGTIDEYASCYAYSKILAENLVCRADDKKGNFRTGALRPAHAIYGHGVENPSSLAWQYLMRGGSPSWIPHVVVNLVSAQNVSVAHLAYENTFLTNPDTPYGGRAYCCTDPNRPIRYGDLYQVLGTLAHPMTPVNFPYVPPTPMVLLAYVIEAYTLVQHRYLSFLPKLKGDISLLQPAVLQMSTVHIIYDDHSAREEIGYRAPVTTMEGLCQQLKYWNDIVEARVETEVAKGKGGEVEQAPTSAVPKPPAAH